MQVILQILIDSMQRLLDLVSCDRIVPIYTTTSTSYPLTTGFQLRSIV